MIQGLAPALQAVRWQTLSDAARRPSSSANPNMAAVSISRLRMRKPLNSKLLSMSR